MKRKISLILSVVLALCAVLGVSSYLYLSDYYRATEPDFPVPMTGFEEVEADNVLYYIPENPSAGMIFYPGGKVQCEAYAPLMKKCAENGILCALVRMPANLAVFGINAADRVLAAHPEIDSWYLAGHSLGGAMAAKYAAGHENDFSALILLAAYSTADLSGTEMKILSIYGTEDGVLNRESYQKNLKNLPADFAEIVIEGGCHAFFGCYGAQDGDGVPAISNESQIDQTVQAILSL